MIIEKAYLDMYPDSRLGVYNFSIKYSAKFNRYNANVKKRGNNIEFNFSKDWREINEDVRSGLIQNLFNKLFKTNVNTLSMDLYELFLKKVHIAIPKHLSDPVLELSFNRVNNEYFNGIIERPNLKWGKQSIRRLGSYEYGSDTITISQIMNKASLDILDFIMYHELLHKKHKFYSKNSRTYHHTREFNQEERKFNDFGNVEKKINKFLRNVKIKKLFFNFK